MKLEFISKSLTYLNSEPLKTLVVLGNSNGAYVPVLFEKEDIEKSDAELFLMALDTLYEENFPDRAEREKFNKVDDKLKRQQELNESNRELLVQVSTISEILVTLAISTSGGMEPNAYSKVAEFIKPLVNDHRYVNNDIVSMPYPFDTNPKWPKGTPTILKFSMPPADGYTYKGQKVEDLLRTGAATVVLPRLG